MSGPDSEEPWFLADVEKDLLALPAHLQGGLRRYLVERVRPGSFLQAVISNDLAQAVLRADENSLPALRDLVLFFYNSAPGPSHGSPESLEAWLGPQAEECS